MENRSATVEGRKGEQRVPDIYVILAVLIAPGLTEMGVHILVAHLFIIFWGNVSFIAPPVAIAAFAAAGIAGADPMKTGWQAPFAWLSFPL